MVGSVLAGDTVGNDGAGLDALLEDFPVELGETELLGLEDLLSARELEFGSSKSFSGSSLVVVSDSDGHQRLSNSDSSDETLGLTVSTSHTSLESISSSARQHLPKKVKIKNESEKIVYLVDSNDVEGVDSDTDVEGILTNSLHEVLVGADSSSFKSFGRKLFQFVGDHDDVEGEEEDGRLPRSKIVDSDLGVWDTSTESGLEKKIRASLFFLTLGYGLFLQYR